MNTPRPGTKGDPERIQQAADALTRAQADLERAQAAVKQARGALEVAVAFHATEYGTLTAGDVTILVNPVDGIRITTKCTRCRGAGVIVASSTHIGGGAYNDHHDICPACGGNGFRSAA